MSHRFRAAVAATADRFAAMLEIGSGGRRQSLLSRLILLLLPPCEEEKPQHSFLQRNNLTSLKLDKKVSNIVPASDSTHNSVDKSQSH